METLTCRLLPFATADGQHNMAADEALLDSAVGGTASLRFYGWSEPTVSLGYFQPHALLEKDKRLSRLPFVRRPSGGDAILHHFELTYALALPAGKRWCGPQPWLPRMHGIITDGLAGCDVTAQLCTEPTAEKFQGLLCFQHVIAGDVVIGGSKVVGSAQRRRKGATLQHGSILLTVSAFAPLLPGIRELSGHSLAAPPIRVAVTAAFAANTGWDVQPSDWTDDEKRRIRELTLTRYTQDAWNRKR